LNKNIERKQKVLFLSYKLNIFSEPKKILTMNKVFTLFLSAFITLSAFAQFNSSVIVGSNNQLNGLSEFLGPLDNSQIYWEDGEYAKYAQVPLISGSNLVVARRTAADNIHEANIVCYNVYTGEELWRTQLPASATSDDYDKIKGINDGVVYCTRANGVTKPATLIALSLADGSFLWESDDNIMPTSTESVNFNSNGDIIVIKDQNGYKCFSKVDGSTLWTLNKDIASGGYCSTMAIYGDIGYYYDRNVGYATVISACNLLTGDSLRSSGPIMIGDAYTQQNMSLAINIDGSIIAHTSEGNLFSLTDNGTNININWDTPASIFITTGNFTVGPDSSIYSVSRTGKLARIRNSDGSIIDTTDVTIFTNTYYQSGGPAVNQRPKMATGRDGIVYISTQQYPDYRLAAYTPNLDLIWEVNSSADGDDLWGIEGLALGDSVLAVNAKGYAIRAYKGRSLTTTTINNISSNDNNTNLYPNPSNGKFFINTNNSNEVISIMDITGRAISAEIINLNNKIEIDISPYPTGIYFVKTSSKTYKVIKN